MAENENGQEKTEDPTQKKLDKAREEGQVARSKELGTTFVLIGGVGALMVLGGSLAKTMRAIMTFNFDISREVAFDPQLMMVHFSNTAMIALDAVTPIFVTLAIAALAGPLALGGWLFSPKPLTPKLERLDPLQGLKRMFSSNSLVELVKSLAKFALVVTIAITTLVTYQSQLLGLSNAALHSAIATMMSTVGWSILAVSSSMIIISAIDVPYQIYDHSKKLKMTRQEVRDEMKDIEGKPEVKGRLRQLQREMAQRRMMEAVPEADVVITNPEHFSVALKYEVGGAGAPRVVAKGSDFMAMKIREVANANDVMILQIAPLARAIYFTTEIDHEIPGKLYLAVAQVLAYVFQLRAYKEGAGRKPKPLADIQLPDDVSYDQRGRPRSSGAAT